MTEVSTKAKHIVIDIAIRNSIEQTILLTFLIKDQIDSSSTSSKVDCNALVLHQSEEAECTYPLKILRGDFLQGFGSITSPPKLSNGGHFTSPLVSILNSR
jgi:hypothetical protein